MDTFHALDAFDYKSCRYVSDRSKIPDRNIDGITTVKLTTQITWADNDTKEASRRAKDKIIERNKHRDTYIDCNVNEDLPNFKVRLVMYDKDAGLPWWMNLCWYWTFTCTWCTWPFRIYIRRKLPKKRFTFEKEVSIHENAFLLLQSLHLL